MQEHHLGVPRPSSDRVVSAYKGSESILGIHLPTLVHYWAKHTETSSSEHPDLPSSSVSQLRGSCMCLQVEATYPPWPLTCSFQRHFNEHRVVAGCRNGESYPRIAAACVQWRLWIVQGLGFFLQMISGFRDFDVYVSQCGFGVGVFSVMETPCLQKNPACSLKLSHLCS